MTTISAKIVADSISPAKDRATSLICTFPRIILAEAKTHRIISDDTAIEFSDISVNDETDLSRNSASSRAVPFKRMVEKVQADPFTPIAWQKDHPGMQGTEYIEGDELKSLVLGHLAGRDHAIDTATYQNKLGATKQICNRYLEPFMWHTALITATEWENFFKLRSSQYNYNGGMYRSRKDVIAALKKDGKSTTKLENASILDWLKMNRGQGEIHIMMLAEAIWDAMNESIPKKLEEGEWHIPFGDNIDESRLSAAILKLYNSHIKPVDEAKIEIATARAARVSYINYEGKDDYEADLKLYDILSKQGHYSPFEHCAKVMTTDEREQFSRNTPHYRDSKVIGCDIDEGWCRNFKGFIQLRHLIEK